MQKFEFYKEREVLNNSGSSGGANNALKVPTNCHYWCVELYGVISSNSPQGVLVDNVWLGLEPVNLSGGGSNIFYVGKDSYSSTICSPNYYYSKNLRIENASSLDIINTNPRINANEVVYLSITRGWFKPLRK